METNQVIQSLAALAQEHRLAVFRLLVQAGSEGMTPGQIAEALGLANATLSFHLKELNHAGLLQATPEGRFIRYRADYTRMQALLDYLTANCCSGVACEVAPGASCCP